MNPLHPLFALIALIIALLAVSAIIRFTRYKPDTVKYSSIDGLRGYLAFFVFLSHAGLWYYYLRSNQWEVPPSRLFAHFAGTSVSMFFMITSFLFVTKLIDAYKQSINWLYFAVSRVLRLTPVYILALAFVLIIVFVQTDFALHEPARVLCKKIFFWTGFGIIDMPDLNGLMHTSYIIARVTWSLIYEWIFYLSLPLIAAVFFRAKFSSVAIIISIAVIAIILHYRHDLYLVFFSSFLGGIVAAFLNRSKQFVQFAITPFATLLSIGAIICCVTLFERPTMPGALILSSIAFIIIACGNKWFGLFANNISRTLGQMSYPIYLLHGICLYVTFKVILPQQAATLTILQHWGVVCIVAAILIALCFGVHIIIEFPCMKAAKTIAVRIENFFLPVKGKQSEGGTPL